MKLPVATSGHRDGVGKGALFNNPVDLLLDRHGRIMVADQNNDCLRMLVKTSTNEWKVSTLKEHKEIHEPDSEEEVLLIAKTPSLTGHDTNNAEGGTLILPASKSAPCPL